MTIYIKRGLGFADWANWALVRKLLYMRALQQAPSQRLPACSVQICPAVNAAGSLMLVKFQGGGACELADSATNPQQRVSLLSTCCHSKC